MGCSIQEIRIGSKEILTTEDTESTERKAKEKKSDFGMRNEEKGNGNAQEGAEETEEGRKFGMGKKYNHGEGRKFGFRISEFGRNHKRTGMKANRKAKEILTTEDTESTERKAKKKKSEFGMRNEEKGTRKHETGRKFAMGNNYQPCA